MNLIFFYLLKVGRFFWRGLRGRGVGGNCINGNLISRTPLPPPLRGKDVKCFFISRVYPHPPHFQYVLRHLGFWGLLCAPPPHFAKSCWDCRPIENWREKCVVASLFSRLFLAEILFLKEIVTSF